VSQGVTVEQDVTTVEVSAGDTVEIIEERLSVTVEADSRTVVVAETPAPTVIEVAPDIVTVAEDRVEVVEVGTQGPAGPCSRIEKRFDWGDATPKTLFTALAGKLVERVVIYIEEAFDGVGAALTVGPAGDPDELLAAGQVDPATPGSYEARPSFAYDADTLIRLTITPGAGASQGRGLLVAELED
jgi:hypothetical protein